MSETGSHTVTIETQEGSRTIAFDIGTIARIEDHCRGTAGELAQTLLPIIPKAEDLIGEGDDRRLTPEAAARIANSLSVSTSQRLLMGALDVRSDELVKLVPTSKLVEASVAVAIGFVVAVSLMLGGKDELDRQADDAEHGEVPTPATAGGTTEGAFEAESLEQPVLSD